MRQSEVCVGFGWARLVLLAAIVCGAALSPGAPTAQAGQLRETRSKHYRISSDLPANELKEYARHMDAVHREYERIFVNFAARNSDRVQMYIFEHEADYVSFLAARGADARNTGGLFFVRGGDAGLATFVREQTKQRVLHTLQHEGFHQFAYMRIGRMPQWANEGLAEYFGEGKVVRGKFRLGLATEGKILAMREAIGAGRHFPIQQLFEMTNQEWNARVTGGDRRAGLMYLQSWAVVHFLVHAEEGQFAPLLEHYLKLVSKSYTPEHAFRESFGTDDLGSLEIAWANFFRGLQADPLGSAIERLEFLGEGMKWLYEEQRETVRDIEELKKLLRASGFYVTRFEHGAERVQSASEDRWFLAPKPLRGRKEPELVVTKSKKMGMPYGLKIEGLRARVELVWFRDDETEELRYEVVLR